MHWEILWWKEKMDITRKKMSSYFQFFEGVRLANLGKRVSERRRTVKLGKIIQLQFSSYFL